MPRAGKSPTIDTHGRPRRLAANNGTLWTTAPTLCEWLPARRGRCRQDRDDRGRSHKMHMDDQKCAGARAPQCGIITVDMGHKSEGPNQLTWFRGVPEVETSSRERGLGFLRKRSTESGKREPTKSAGTWEFGITRTIEKSEKAFGPDVRRSTEPPQGVNAAPPIPFLTSCIRA